MKVLLIIIIVYLLFVLFFFMMSFSKFFKVPIQMLVPKKAYSNYLINKEKMLSLPRKDITIQNGKLTLRGHYIEGKNAKRTVIMVHGWRSNWILDFAPQAFWMLENECNLLMIEQRARGSDGIFITFGIKEKDDLHCWMNYIEENTDLPCYLYGTSMGATTVLMVSNLENKLLKGIIADSAFTNPYQELKEAGKSWFHLPEYPFLPTLNLYCKLLMGVDYKAYSTIDVLKEAKYPILLFHGTNDNFVNCHMSKDNYEVIPTKKELYIYEGVSHCASYAMKTSEYQKILLDFFNS